MAELRGGREHHTADWIERNRFSGVDCESGQHGANAQEELQAVRAACQIDRQFAGAAQDFGAQKVPGDEGALGAARGCSAESLSSGE